MLLPLNKLKIYYILSSHVSFRKPSNKNEYGLPPVLAEEAVGNQTDNEILKLRRELSVEHERVLNLTSQLATNAHVVAAFEQSLANMTARLQHLTSTAEKKDHELNELRRSIELYKQVRFNFHVILSIILGVILENNYFFGDFF